ncbi:MAG: sigma-70 family RNA polymerase sigma factor [Desulfobacterales bacterium]|nr:sigma-70 family RNA polymerase sigma factor [Desulfobacterales bacterium]
MRFSNKKEASYLSDPDVQLMLELKKGDRSAFEALMRKYYPRILNFIYRFFSNRQIAEDLSQDVFMKVYKSALHYRPQSQFQTWLYTIAKNVCLNELRRKRGLMVSLDETHKSGENELRKEIADPNTDPVKALLQKEKVALIRAAINDLPENQRIAVILKRHENFSYTQIAATLNVTDKAVKSLLSRAKVNLKNKLISIRLD